MRGVKKRGKCEIVFKKDRRANGKDREMGSDCSEPDWGS